MVRLGEAKAYSNRPLIRRETNADMEAREAAKKEVERIQNTPVITQLAAHIRSAFQSAVTARHIVTERMIQCLRQREGEYDPETLSLINKQNGTKIYMMLTDIKCRALESWLKDIMLPAGERPYAIEPTPIPEIPQNLVLKAQFMFFQDYFGNMKNQAAQMGQDQDIQEIEQVEAYVYQQLRENGGKNLNLSMLNQDDLLGAAQEFESAILKAVREQAKKDTSSVENNIDDELRQGGWYKVLAEVIKDFATYPAAFVEGPLYRRRKVLEWTPIPNSNLSSVSPVEKVIPEYVRIRPFDVYPSPAAKSLQDGTLCLLKKYSRSDLNALRDVPGYDTDAINTVLEQYANGYREHLTYDTEIEKLHNRPSESLDPECHIDCVKFFGSVQGFKLRDWGMSSEQIPDPYKEYHIIAYLVGNYIIGARLNPHPLGRRNVYSASFERQNDSIWGKSVPELMHDIQQMCNSQARAICNNVAIASGPQIAQFADLVPAEQENTEIYPWKIWEFISKEVRTAGLRPIEFYQPPLVSGELLQIYDYFFKQASEVTGIPAYVYGSDTIGGAGKTASGLSMLMNAAGKGLRLAASNIDEGIISPSVEEHWLTLMLTRPELAKGDCKIVARASEYLVQQEALQIRRTEFAQMINNQTDLQITGIEGRASILRETAKALKMDVDKIIPTKEEMLSTQVEQQVQQIIMKLSQVLGIPPDQLLAALQSPAPRPGGGQPGQQQALDASGSPMAGQDVRMFNQ